MSKTEAVLEYQARKRLIKKAKVGAAVIAAAGVYILHRRQMDAIITLSQAAVNETMWSSFDSGVKYGLALAKDAANSDLWMDTKDAAQTAGKYAFEAFDKAS